MFRIGDFAKIARVSVKTLHYYDEIGLLKPEVVILFHQGKDMIAQEDWPNRMA